MRCPVCKSGATYQPGQPAGTMVCAECGTILPLVAWTTLEYRVQVAAQTEADKKTLQTLERDIIKTLCHLRPEPPES